jgi:hypothetical protein
MWIWPIEVCLAQRSPGPYPHYGTALSANFSVAQFLLSIKTVALKVHDHYLLTNFMSTLLGVKSRLTRVEMSQFDTIHSICLGLF